MKCRLCKFWMDRALDDGRPLSARIERHVANCEECRRYHEAQQSVVRRLQAGRRMAGAIETADSTLAAAAGATEIAPPFLRARILSEIRSDSRREAPVSVTRWAWVGAAAAAVALAVIVDWSPTEEGSPLIASNERASASVSKSTANFLEATTRFADGGRLLQVATNLDQPLQREMNLVLGDARAALRSLQAEFVPATLLARSQ